MSQIFEPTSVGMANFGWYWTKFNCFKWPNIEHIIQPSGHTARYLDRIETIASYVQVKS